MNIKKAKEVPIEVILKCLGLEPEREKNSELWFKSPLRQENTASFHVKPSANIWYDFGEGKGGNSLDLVCAYLNSKGEDDTVADALRWLRNMTIEPISYNPSPKPKPVDKSNAWLLKKSQPLQKVALTRYLEQRGIGLELATKHLCEVFVQNPVSGKGMYAIGFRNEDDGYELRNPFFKSCVAPKTITFIRGEQPKPDGIHIFEGFMDYLSAESRCPEQVANHDRIVLNSTSCLDDAFAYIKGYGYQIVHSWLDNDAAGTKAQDKLNEFVKTQQSLMHKPMNAIYAPYKDVNEWHMTTQKPKH
jgi:hypothetical protein